MLTEKLLKVTIAGGTEWVMVLLLVLSVISISVVIERAVFFRKRRRQLDRLDDQLSPAIRQSDTKLIEDVLGRTGDPTLKAVASTSGRTDRAAADKIVASELGRERLRLEQRLTFLGTLGNNAPFIGLFGTVLGIIRAFSDLALDTKGGSSAVMAGVSEALVATALGLFVAIPAVIAFNYFQKQVDHVLSVTESLAQGIQAVEPSGASSAASKKA
jgi:biopolymer transport protein ExbB/TolQ